MTFESVDLYTNKMDLPTVGGRKKRSKKRCDTAIRPVSEDRSLPPNDLLAADLLYKKFDFVCQS